MQPNDIIPFIRRKDYQFTKFIGQGGLGKTALIYDDQLNEFFACKKYSPSSGSFIETYFPNFVNEIRTLYKLYHINVVRIFSYFLYPDEKTGFILMEYVNGQNIRDYLQSNPHRLDSIFTQTIDGFSYLEQHKILHRDIRPDNILVSQEGLVKIIDFGFGKPVEMEEDFAKSISINWLYTRPSEFTNGRYDFKTDIYFVGKLFEEIIISLNIDDFTYKNLLVGMIQQDYKSRIATFSEIKQSILNPKIAGPAFTYDERDIYKAFANSLESIIFKVSPDAVYEDQIETIIIELDSAYTNSMLEDYVQNPTIVVKCFIKGTYLYNRKTIMSTDTLRDFLFMIKSLSVDKQKILLNNLWQRFNTIKRIQEEPDDLPF